MSAKQALDDKLQGSVAACLRCGGVVNNQIKEGLLLSLSVKEILKSVNIWQSYKQGRTGPPGNLALARWAGWSASPVGRHVKC